MKKRILFYILLVYSVAINSQSLQKEYIQKLKIKSVIITDSTKSSSNVEFYNEDGNVIMSGIKKDNYMVFTKQCIYDENKLLQEERLFDEKAQYNGVIRYYYDAKKYLIKKESFDADDLIESVWTFEYDANGKKIKETEKKASQEKLITKFKYENNIVVEEEIYNEKNEKKIIKKYEYDKNRRITKETLVYLKPKDSHITSYTYNDKGILISKYSTMSHSGAHYGISYIYNDKDILEYSEEKNSFNKPQKLYYKIDFF